MAKSTRIPIRIRKFRDSDATRLYPLIRRTLLTTTAKHYPAWLVRQIVEKRKPKALKELAKIDSVFVALSGNRIVGTVKLSPIGGLGSLFVRPDFYCRGIGTKLVRHVLRAAKRRKLKSVRGNSATNAVEFYRKLGFKVGRKVAFKKDIVTYCVSYALK